jgi:hypothetical protein
MIQVKMLSMAMGLIKKMRPYDHIDGLVFVGYVFLFMLIYVIVPLHFTIWIIAAKVNRYLLCGPAPGPNTTMFEGTYCFLWLPCYIPHVSEHLFQVGILFFSDMDQNGDTVPQ